ncbi:MAG: hypothetical protein HY049_00630 [Acidobacteria bacterium]|nr:hypothetical protein [Acidobacteriota bacterium]
MDSPEGSPADLALDTSAEAERIQLELWRQMSPAEKLHLVSEISRAADTMCLAGIRMRHPEASDREIFLRFAIIRLGAELAGRAYPESRGLSSPIS